jgi:hypothetical protein
MSQNEEFMSALGADLPKEKRLIVCGFAGDPNKVGPSAWKPRPWSADKDLMYDCGILPKMNAYVTISSFGRAADNSFRRRGACFDAGRALFIDDVGTGLGSKVSPDIIKALPPTSIVETSPNNHQCLYILDRPETDMGRFDGLIRAFISAQLLGHDPGQAGVTRVARIPGYVNDKAKYGGAFKVTLLELNEKRYSIDALLKAFKLTINGTIVKPLRLVSEDAIERNRMFLVYWKWLYARGMLKRDTPDSSGWMEVHCPFIGNHTDRADTGAAIREPAPENGYFGSFRCHHGNSVCSSAGWHELTDWINETSGEELENAAEDNG